MNKILSGLNSYNYALISEAGTPVISDPGKDLVYQAGELGFSVIAIPGASSVTSALSISGMKGDKFFFLGFLSRRSKERKLELNSVKNIKETLIIFESPHRLISSLEDMKGIFGDRRVSVCREMTNILEEVFRLRFRDRVRFSKVIEEHQLFHHHARGSARTRGGTRRRRRARPGRAARRT